MTDVFSRSAKGPVKTLLDKLHYVRPVRLPVVVIRRNINRIFYLVGSLIFTVRAFFYCLVKSEETPNPRPAATTHVAVPSGFRVFGMVAALCAYTTITYWTRKHVKRLSEIQQMEHSTGKRVCVR